MSDRRETTDRRETAERRRPKRRQAGDDQVLIVELNGSELLATLMQQQSGDSPDVVASHSLTWRREAAVLNSELGQEELTEAMRTIAKHFKLVTTSVHFVLSGEYCVTRAIRGASDVVRTELQRISQRSRLYLSLGPGEKVVVSNTRTLDARHQHALAAVCNEKTLQTIRLAAEGTGLQIVSIEPALSAANRSVSRIPDLPETPYLLIHLDGSAPDIGVCQEGQLLLDYRPGGRTSPAELPSLLQEHRNRLQRHTGRQLQQAPPELTTVYLCGQERAVDEALSAFLSQGDFQAVKAESRRVQASWQLVEGDSGQASVPSLGALLANHYLTDADRDAPNLMEHIIASTQEPLKPTLIRAAIPLAAMLLLALGMFVVNFHEQTELSQLEADYQKLAPVEMRAKELRLQLLRTESKAVQLKAVAAQLNRPLGSETLQHLANCMPSDVWLRRLTLDHGKSMQIEGSSFLPAGVYDFVRWLEQAPSFAEVALKATRPTSSEAGPVTGFTLELQVADSDDQAKTPTEKVARNE